MAGHMQNDAKEIMNFKLTNKLILSGLHQDTGKHIKNSLTMANPKFKDLERLGKWTEGTSRRLTFFEEQGGSLFCPRGFADRAFVICKEHRENITIIDDRRILEPVSFDFKGKLRPFQEDAIKAMYHIPMGCYRPARAAEKR